MGSMCKLFGQALDLIFPMQGIPDDLTANSFGGHARPTLASVFGFPVNFDIHHSPAFQQSHGYRGGSGTAIRDEQYGP